MRESLVMSAFEFGAGNARKIVGLPLYALGAVVTFLTPRVPHLWVFGSGIGLGEGALPLYLTARRHLPHYRLVWMARSRAELDEARAAGFDAVRKDGWRGFWMTARARVVIVTHGFGDANRYGVRGAFIVQLWHGLPFKHLHLDSPSTYRVSFLPDWALVRRLLGRAYRRAGAAIALFPVASERVKPSIVSGFGTQPDNVVVLGDVRDDVLFAPNATERAAALMRDIVPQPFANASVILFAPTWRDGGADPTVPTSQEWDAIAGWLEANDAVLLVRSHPLGRGDFSFGPARSARIIPLYADLVRDLNPLLWAVDAVVTDYSSLVFDYALVGGPVVHLTPDLSEYTSSRGFYLSPSEFIGEQPATTWAAALQQLTAALREGPDGPRHRQSAHLRQEFFDIPAAGSADRVINEIVARTEPGVAPAKPVVTRERPEISDITFDSESASLRLVGIEAGTLVGSRAQVTVLDGALSLLQARWGGEPLALPSGTYRLQLTDGSTRVVVKPEPLEIQHALFHGTVRPDSGGLVLDVRPPLDSDEIGPEAQKSLEIAYRHGKRTPADAVFFESFRGRTAACNPRGIDRWIAETRPDTTRYWSVVDGSVEIPPGAVRLIEGSKEWWRVRGTARVFVVNDWLRKRWDQRPHQHVLQTWHGSTLKRLARDRPNVGVRTRIAASREGKRWDALLAQNEFSASNLQSAYAYRGRIWVDGYPRNDELANGYPAELIKHRLGIDGEQRVVLWAPTWREDRRSMVDHLDPVALAELLGPAWLVLVRGHSSTWEFGSDISGTGVLDVTTYPDASDLLLVADVLVTDYSSIMFDWLVTGRPIVYCVPDLDRYASELRGFYADLLAEAPGPVVQTTAQVAYEVSHAEAEAGRFEAILTSWRERFAYRDDGHAAEHVVNHMLELGWFGTDEVLMPRAVEASATSSKHAEQEPGAPAQMHRLEDDREP
jgi:CDP-glycerol glycerophosphotransferase